MIRTILIALSLALFLSSNVHAREKAINHLRTKLISRTETHIGAPGLSAGNIWTAVSSVTDRSGKNIGHAFVRKIVIADPSGNPYARDIQIQYNLPDGNVLAGGVITDYGIQGPTSMVELVVTGGTGIYRKKRGTVRIAPLSPDGKEYLVHIALCC